VNLFTTNPCVDARPSSSRRARARVRVTASLACVSLAALWIHPALGQKREDKAKSERADKSDARGTTEIGISVGENKSLPATDIKQYSDGTPGIIDIKATPEGKLIIVGLRPGTTSVLLIKNNGQELTFVISVFARSPQLVESEVNQLLEGFPSVRLRRIGGRFFMDGTVVSEAELKRVSQIALLYPGQVESLVTIGTKDRTTNIRIDFYFVQFNKESSYQVGIAWPSSLGGDPFTQSNFTYDLRGGSWTTAAASLVNQPLPALDLASRHGWAKVMKQAAVITANGSEAMFESGGEQNYPVSSGLVSSIQRIPFGVTVTLQPFFEPTTRELDIKVNADVTDLTPPATNTPLPGRNITKLTTVVHLKIGQSFVISGIHTESQQHQIDGLPLLSRIPIVGPLFGTHGDRKIEVEGAIFIVPNVVQATTKAASELVGEALKRYEDYDGTVPSAFLHTPKSTAPSGSAKPSPEDHE
jgi:pilus assembly protein CpaC